MDMASKRILASQNQFGLKKTKKNPDWLSQELSQCEFKDKRLGKRFINLAKKMWGGLGETIPFACQDWANAKAAYRFFSNKTVSEKNILGGHFQSTSDRVANAEGPILVLQDTTEFSYQREKPELVGITKIIPNGKDLLGQKKYYTKCGILMHSSLAVTTDGLPLGLSAIKFWTRKKFKGTNALKNKVNPTRMPIEKKESYRWLENLRQSTQLLNAPNRCIHVGDRESDIYELYCMAQKLKTNFVVRTCVDRLAGDGQHTIANEMDEVKIKGLHRIEVQDKKGNISKAILEIKYRVIRVLPPIGKQKKYPNLLLTVIHAEERGKPRNREKISWKLITNLSIKSRQEAIEKLRWYAMRWKIETFHKILKSGCKAEESKLRTADRLTNLISVFCILSWRVFWMTMVNRSCSNASPRLALTEIEINLLDTIKKSKSLERNKKLSDYLIQIAKLGGYLARVSDPPPGNTVMWRGLSRLTDINLGFDLALKIVGN
jgi:hypothetical protein